MRQRFGWALTAIVLAAAAVRLFRIDHFSFGLDEVLQGFWIRGGWPFFWKSLEFDAVHPPLDYLIDRFLAFAHPSDAVLKIPAIAWGCGTVAAFGALIARRAGAAAGLAAACLLAFAPYHVRYSQELRPYSLGLFLLCLSLLALDAFLARPSAARLIALYLACLATAYALYLSALVLALAAAALLVEDARGADPGRARAARRFLAWSPAFLLALWIGYLPWWPVVLEAARRPPPIPAEPLTGHRFGQILSFFAFAPVDGEPLRRGTLFLTAFALIGLALALGRPRTRFLAAWMILGFVAVETLGQLHPHWYGSRRFLPAGLALTALSALTFGDLLRRPVTRLPAICLLATVLVLDLRGLTRYFREGRADWRTLADFLRGTAAPNERVFMENQYGQLCLAYYLAGPDWLAQGEAGEKPARDLPNLEGQIVRLTWSWKPGARAWLVLAGEPKHAELRKWAERFPGFSFPKAEGAALRRLDPELRGEALAGVR